MLLLTKCWNYRQLAYVAFTENHTVHVSTHFCRKSSRRNQTTWKADPQGQIYDTRHRMCFIRRLQFPSSSTFPVIDYQPGSPLCSPAIWMACVLDTYSVQHFLILSSFSSSAFFDVAVRHNKRSTTYYNHSHLERLYSHKILATSVFRLLHVFLWQYNHVFNFFYWNFFPQNVLSSSLV